jgi:hypothetical protein
VCAWGWKDWSVIKVGESNEACGDLDELSMSTDRAIYPFDV